MKGVPGFLLVLSLALTGCDQSLHTVYEPAQASRAAQVAQAARVTIYRDDFGVPHVHGRTDADAAFGFAYAQAEDNFAQLEENFIRALGRASEAFGESELLADWLNRALDIPRISEAEYQKSDEKLRMLLDGFAAGLNHYLANHPTLSPRLLDRFEPWYPLALIRYLYYQRGFFRQLGVSNAMIREAANRSEAMATALNSRKVIGREDYGASAVVTPNGAVALEHAGFVDTGFEHAGLENLLPRGEMGSNAWAVMPGRTAAGNALLFINPHLPFFGVAQVYEGHVMSDNGWNFSGYTRFGFPLPYVGFNEHLGWASTDNAADQSDLYLESFDNPDDPLSYRYGNEYRRAVEWTDSIFVRVDSTLDMRRFVMHKTHHGPVVAWLRGKPAAARMAKFEDSGWLDQWVAMTRAGNMGEFRKAADRLDMLFGNYLYADIDGNIYYVYNAAVPRRSERFNWQAPVDGSDPATEWQGYHTIDDLPRVLNPPSGWIQNTNSTPFLTTKEGNPVRRNFPSYMVTERDNARSRSARRILSENDSFTFDAWARLSYDTFVTQAASELPATLDALTGSSTLGEHPPDSLVQAVNLLKDWDYRSRITSVEMTLWFYWRTLRIQDPEVSLRKTMANLRQKWGSWKVPWGEVNRHQRPFYREGSGGDNQRLGNLASARRSVAKPAGFSDSQPSLPVAGIPSWAGGMFTFWSGPVPGMKRMYGTGGNSYVAVVEFGSRIRAKSIHAFGSSGNPDSPHFFDQAPLYVKGKYKNAWLSLDDVRTHAVRSYRPGSESE